MTGKPIRMILAGAGFMGRTHLGKAKDLDSVQFIAVADTDKKRADSTAGQFGLKAFGSLKDAIRQLEPDAVDICVPTSCHLPLIGICASHRTHVLCEKPVALNMADAREIKRIVGKHRIRIMVAHVLRFWPEYVYAVETVQKQVFGRVLAVECKRFSVLPDWNSWMTRPKVGGGVVIDLQIHDMDFVLQLLGRPSAIKASGRKHDGTFNAVHNQWIYESGIPVITQASFIMPASYPFRMYFAIETEGALLEMDSWRPNRERLKVFSSRGKPRTPALRDVNAYGSEIDYFARKLRKGEEFERSPLEEAIAALEICLASERSCRTHKPVRLV